MSEPTTITHQGFLREGSYGESDYVLFVEEKGTRPYDRIPFAEILEDEISCRQVTARYWIVDKECTREEANEAFMRQVMGLADAEYLANYSEVTGYLYTDEHAKIGGHDLIEEFKESIGKYLILEIEVHDSSEAGRDA